MKVKFLLDIAFPETAVESGNPTLGTGCYDFVRFEGLMLIMINACKHFRIDVSICISLTYLNLLSS